MAMQKLIALEECRPDRGTLVQAGGRALAVFYFPAERRAVVTDNACPHAGGSMAAGTVEDGAAVCPYHYWAFDLHTGRAQHNAQVRLPIYPAEIRNDAVWADLPGG